MSYQLAAIGELLIDLVQEHPLQSGAPKFTANPGGAPGNVCVMFSKLGGEASFIGKVGRDAFGSQLRHALESQGVQTSGLIADDTSNTSLAFVSLDQSGERSFTFYRKHSADTQLCAEEIPQESWNEARVLHFGSVSMSDEPSRSATFATVEKAREQKLLISYDPNFRPFLWPDLDEARNVLWRGVKLADVLKVSEEEMLLLTGETDPAKGAQHLKKGGPKLILITLGCKGAYYCCNGCEGLVESFCVPTVDSTGAGDAFVGAFLYSLFQLKNMRLERLHDEEIRSIIRFSNAAAALANTGYGAIPAMPDRNAIEELLSSQA